MPSIEEKIAAKKKEVDESDAAWVKIRDELGGKEEIEEVHRFFIERIQALREYREQLRKTFKELDEEVIRSIKSLTKDGNLVELKRLWLNSSAIQKGLPIMKEYEIQEDEIPDDEDEDEDEDEDDAESF
ncbi:hypothetical protein DM02DRAFT_733128 [Periconia macrospinosa]|uniref:Uncharacterized protein n=1 Tax=Periconia macrospinosa TaxID=97972 RepID=A0A2V1D5R5_9PLEO|nr:hypothetical protein DM02DRAFT_733128 [Periconia macrospinosa]